MGEERGSGRNRLVKDGAGIDAAFEEPDVPFQKGVNCVNIRKSPRFESKDVGL